MVKKVEKQIGVLQTVETFNAEVLTEGHDSAVLVISSNKDDAVLEKFVDAFIDCKTRYKMMRHRGIRWYAADLNSAQNINFQTQVGTVPAMLFYPAFHKGTAVHRYSGDIDSIKMSKFLHKKADIKFEWKPKFFRPKEKKKSPFIEMDMDANGNAINDPGQIAKLQQKQNSEEHEKEDYVRYLESQMSDL